MVMIWRVLKSWWYPKSPYAFVLRHGHSWRLDENWGYPRVPRWLEKPAYMWCGWWLCLNISTSGTIYGTSMYIPRQIKHNWKHHLWDDSLNVPSFMLRRQQRPDFLGTQHATATAGEHPQIAWTIADFLWILRSDHFGGSIVMGGPPIAGWFSLGKIPSRI